MSTGLTGLPTRPALPALPGQDSGRVQAPAGSTRRVPGLGVRLFHVVRLWLGSVLSPDEA